MRGQQANKGEWGSGGTDPFWTDHLSNTCPIVIPSFQPPQAGSAVGPPLRVNWRRSHLLCDLLEILRVPPEPFSACPPSSFAEGRLVRLSPHQGAIGLYEDLLGAAVLDYGCLGEVRVELRCDE